MKKIGLIIIVALALTVVAAYGATWYGTQQLLIQLKKDMAEKGILTWQRVSPGLDGTVEVQELELTLFELTQPVRIASATLSTGSAGTLVKWLLVPGSPWPEGVRLSLQQARLIVRPKLTKQWLELSPDGQVPWPRPWHLRACDGRSQLGGTDLLAMGVDQLEMDLMLHWLGAKGDGYELAGELNAGDLGGVDFNVQSQALPASLTQLSDRGSLQWRNLHLIVRDGGFMRRLAAYCAKTRYPDPAGWASAETEALQLELGEWGITPAPGLLKLHQDWLYQGGEISAKLPPSPAVEFAEIGAVVAYLNQVELSIQHNGRPMAEIGLEVQHDTFAAAAVAATQPAAPPPVAAESVEPDRLAWRETAVVSAEYWQDRLVRVETVTGHSVEGRLSAINKRQFVIVRRVAGGEFASPVARGEVATLSVWRRPGESAPATVVAVEPVPTDTGGRRSDLAPASSPVSGAEESTVAPIF